MRFGQSTQEHEEALAHRGEGAAFIKYLRKGDNEFQIIDEYDKWVWYWEHYNPGGFPFPCTNDRDTCPGCTSLNEKMSKATRRAAFNAHDGQYTNVWKVPKTVAEKLKNRYDRLGTITDRPYVITQIKNAEGFYDYDIEGGPQTVLDMAEIGKYVRDPEEMLAAAWTQAWGDPATAEQTRAKAEQIAEESSLQQKIAEDRGRAAVAATQAKDPLPSWAAESAKKEEAEKTKEYDESDLRAMEPQMLRDLCVAEGLPEPPEDLKTSGRIVDWMLTQVG